MKTNIAISQKRWSLITWVFIPLILAWISTNYLIGVLRPPQWGTVAVQSPTNQVEQVKNTIPKVSYQGKGLVTLWFDDAWITQYTVAYPMLEKYGYKGALAVPTKLVGVDSYMSWPQVKRMDNAGWEITSHTRNHSCTMDRANEDEIESEIGGAKKDLAEMGFDAQNYVSPCGVDSPLMKNTALKYYISYRTSNPGFNPIPATNNYSLLVQTMRNTVSVAQVKLWIKQANDEHKWLIIMFHQLDNSNTEYSVSPETLKAILDEIAKTQTQVVLPTQALELVIEQPLSLNTEVK
jgi:peptidoglycan/xylan/chitin deacetylase (PgdA/CDA1 family)